MRIGGDLRDEGAQLVAVETLVRTASTAAAPSSRAGLRLRRAPCTASPSGSSARRADGAVGAVDEPVDADLAEHRVDGPGAVGGDVEEHAGSLAATPPRATSRSRCSGARPASIAKHTRSRGCAGRPQTAKACHAACISAT